MMPFTSIQIPHKPTMIVTAKIFRGMTPMLRKMIKATMGTAISPMPVRIFFESIGSNRCRSFPEHLVNQAGRLFVAESLYQQISDDLLGRVAPKNLCLGFMLRLGGVNLSGTSRGSLWPGGRRN